MFPEKFSTAETGNFKRRFMTLNERPQNNTAIGADYQNKTNFCLDSFTFQNIPLLKKK